MKKFHKNLIVFEGIDGSGKTTQARMLAKYLRECGKDVLLTKDNGESPFGEEIRSILLSEKCPDDPRSQALLFTAARTESLTKYILPHLRKGGIVILDRFVGSTLSMQGYGSRLYQKKGDPDPVLFAETMVDIIPDRPGHTFLLDMDPEEIRGRVLKRNEAPLDTFEKKNIEFHKIIRRSMIENIPKLTKNLTMINAKENEEKIRQKIKKEINYLIG